MSETKYKLTYFNLNAVGEPIRWLFKVARVPFEDERIDFADWPKLKESGRLPLKTVPILEMDGQVFTQSSTILRYLGKKFGLVTGDELLDMREDQVCEIVNDGVVAFRAKFLHVDPHEKEEVRQELAATTYSVLLKHLHEIVTSTPGNFITGSKLTYADLALANWLDIWEDQQLLPPNFKEEFPALVKQKETVLAVPEIQEWVQIRPKVLF